MNSNSIFFFMMMLKRSRRRHHGPHGWGHRGRTNPTAMTIAALLLHPHALTYLPRRSPPLAIEVSSGRNWSVWRGRTLDKDPPPPRSPTALAFFPPIFFFFSFAFLLRSHRIARGHIGIYGNFYRTRDFYTRRKKQGGFSPLTRVRQLLSEECGRRRAGTALEGRVSERERPGRRKARED